MSFLEKIQNQPKNIRKIIFWVIIIFLGILFLIMWVYSVKTKLEEIKGNKFLEDLGPSKSNEKLESWPKVETPKTPEITDEEWKKIEQELEKEAESQSLPGQK
jgi:hypothetical protein